ncbi:ABC transporter ATP-binding protein [Pontibacter populi]|uniref:ABC transporter ATP-binding protein n=1 Tax=Pontibacter populi TaxID=890055 RepID=A0ABV1RWX2_9BACT
MELVIQNLSKTYPNGTQALKNINLTIPKGMFGLLGPNGAGKSSLMRTIATLQEADTGSIMLGDLDVLRQKEEMRKVLGYLPQEFGVYPKVSAEEMLDHFAVLKGISDNKERKEVVAALLQQTNLYDVRKKNLGGYSGGMKQRFGIAQALLGNPQLIIVDEPTAGLDPAERNRFHNLLSEIGENIIVILSTHIVEDVTDLCRNFAIINKGEVLLTGDPLEVINKLNGRIWRKFIHKSELAAHQQQHDVISSRLFAGKTIIHVLSDVQPGMDFEPVNSDLEDVYFSKIHEASRQQKENTEELVVN